MNIERVLNMSFDLGDNFKAKYKLKQEIGRSTNSRVHQISRLEGNKEDLVVKILYPKSRKSSDKLSRRLEREINTMIELRKANIDVVEVIDYDTNSVNSWYVMPRGNTLCNTLEKENFRDINERIKIATIIIKILNQVHDLGFAHRDLKLENILVINERIELADFGLVWHPDFAENLTEERERIGNWKTIAPELKRRNIIVSDYQPSDVFSLTKVVWMILTMDYDCFDGQYNIDSEHGQRLSEIELNAEKMIHNLFHRGTEENYQRRMPMTQFREVFLKWIDINADERASNKANFDNSINNVLLKNRLSETIITDFNEIFDSLRDITVSCLAHVSFKRNLQGTHILKEIELAELTDCLQMKFSGELQNYIFLCKPMELRIRKFAGDRYSVVLAIDELNEESVTEDIIYLKEDVDQDELLRSTKIRLRKEVLELTWLNK